MYRTHFTKCLVQKNKFFSEVKLRIIFEKKKYFWQSSTTDKDISKIPTDSSSAGQQLNDSKNNMKIHWKKSCVNSTKTLKISKT